MSHEWLSQPKPETIETMIRLTTLPAVEFFKIPSKFEEYLRFKESYCRDPYSQRQLAPIERQRSGETLNFDFEIAAGVSRDSSHMIQVREARGISEKMLSEAQRLFIVTYDFGTHETTEWKEKPRQDTKALGIEDFVNPLNLNPQGLRIDLIPDRLNEVESLPRVTASTSLLEAIGQSRVIENGLVGENAKNATIRFNDQAMEVWFDNTREPKKFVSFAEIESQLYWLGKAEMQGLLGEEDHSHQAMKEYLHLAA